MGIGAMLRVMLIAVTALATYSGMARAADVSVGLRQLFQAGQKNTPPAVTAAREAYARLKRVAPDDPRIDYAYGLVLANQRRYADAIAPLTRYLEENPADFSALQIKTWADLQAKRYNEVLVTATALGKRFPAQGAEPPPAEHIETARFLGTIFGYLELVRPRGVDAGEVTDRKNAFLPRLGETCLAAYDQGRDVVGSQLAKLEADRETRRQRADEAAALRKEEAKSKLDEDQEKLAIEREVSQSSIENINDARRELDLIRRQYQSLLQDREKLGSQYVTLQAQLGQLQTPTVTNNRRAITSNRPDSRVRPGDRYRATTTNTSVTVSPEDAFRAQSLAIALGQLNVQAVAMDRRLLSLQARAAELTASEAKQRQAYEESRAIAERVTKRTKVLEKQLDRQLLGPPAQRARATGRMLYYSTYVELPYVPEARRILGWYSK